MENRLQIGYILLIAPLVIWGFVLAMSLDINFYQGIFQIIGPTITLVLFFTGGFVFPLSSLVIGINGVREGDKKKKNIALIILSAAFIAGMVGALVLRLA